MAVRKASRVLIKSYKRPMFYWKQKGICHKSGAWHKAQHFNQFTLLKRLKLLA
ncbi:hypothetical protein TERTU_0576 [Teredinibacter turnerae T7901]|uniref:Uncharacterized protein n=1 Tax=Teredinibacter turnerae (strain ATCC 39867 / T7901) TaxID=377629 RepID=C5BN72_TERTT|nr:hypothetical protein TERTU_0576 [Teredinibacter turnerae T7901]